MFNSNRLKSNRFYASKYAFVEADISLGPGKRSRLRYFQIRSLDHPVRVENALISGAPVVECRSEDKAMEFVNLPAHFDGKLILLNEPYELEPNAKLVVSVIGARTSTGAAFHPRSLVRCSRKRRLLILKAVLI